MSSRNRIVGSPVIGGANASRNSTAQSRSSGGNHWRSLALLLLIVIIPWALYIHLHSHSESQVLDAAAEVAHAKVAALQSSSAGDGQHGKLRKASAKSKPKPKSHAKPNPSATMSKLDTAIAIKEGTKGKESVLESEEEEDAAKHEGEEADEQRHVAAITTTTSGGGRAVKKSKPAAMRKRKPRSPPPKKLTAEEIAFMLEHQQLVTAKFPYVTTTPLDASDQPVLGAVPTAGAKPLFGFKHKGTDAVFALAAGYGKVEYQRFVGSLRKFGFADDIVLAVSRAADMRTGVKQYLRDMGVLSYEFPVDCLKQDHARSVAGPDKCRLEDDLLGFPDPRPYRSFANIRFSVYEYWLRHYSEQSYVLLIDFRDTIFQGNPFHTLPQFPQRESGPKYELQLYMENSDLKNIGKCMFNAKWIRTCFGKPALAAIGHHAVLCSGSTWGSLTAMRHYVRTMLRAMDSAQCWIKGSDQGYHNFLFYNGHFNTTAGSATLNPQGHGIVNTIGALNGASIPEDKKGPLGSYWKLRDEEGFILNFDGTRSTCVHQWDRFKDELQTFVDTKLY